MNNQEWIEKLAIEAVFARYAFAVDGYDAEGWANCFTDDGVFEVSGGSTKIVFKGRSALLKFIKSHIANLPGTRHMMSNHLTEIKGDEAAHKCSLAAFLYRSGKVYTLATGWYESRLKKLDGEWRISYRKGHIDNADAFASGEILPFVKKHREALAEIMATMS